MKTSTTTGNSFETILNSAANKKNIKNSNALINNIKKPFLSFLSMLFMVLLFSSCSRNSTGCGTWPLANTKTYKIYKNEVRPSLSKNKNVFASYKKYNR